MNRTPMTPAPDSRAHSSPRGRLARPLAALLAVLLATVSLVASAPSPRAAAATSQGVTATFLVDGQPQYDGTVVWESGREYALRLQYQRALLTPGQHVRLALSDGLSVADAALVVPAGNTIIERIDREADGTFTVVFRDPLDATINQGIFTLAFTVDPVTESVPRSVEVTLDSDTTAIDVIVQAPGDEFAEVVDGVEKNASGALDSFASVDADGLVELDPALIGHPIDYRLEVATETALDGYRIGDTLDPGLAYLPASFAAELTSWDADGLNRRTEPFAVTPAIAGSSFTLDGLSLPAASILEVRYQAAVADAAALEALRAALQAEYDALGGDPGDWRVSLGNTAVFGDPGIERTASVGIGGRVTGPPMPNLGAAFGKTTSILNRPAVELDETGALVDPLAVTYTLTADLRVFDGVTSADFVLGRNVVIEDALPPQLTWDPSATSVVTARVNGADRPLVPATGLGGDPLAEMADDARVGQYLIDGDRLLVNVGRDNTERWLLELRTVLASVEGAASRAYDVSTTAYDVVNSADFHFRDDRGPHRASRTVTVLDRGDTTGGVDDPTIFSKRAVEDAIATNPGSVAWVEYEFRLAGREFDATRIRLVDHAETSTFDLSDLGEIADRVRGTYDGSLALDADDFIVARAAGGGLELALSPAGIATITPRGLDRALVVRLELPTHPFTGKETMTIVNTASLVGDDLAFDYVSRAESSATSYGDEMEVRKRLYDAASDAWTDTLRVPLDADGRLSADVFVYRVQMLPHGDYHGIVIAPIEDVLPAGLEFLGFVDPARVAEAGIVAVDEVALDGNLQARWVADDGMVEVVNRGGTTLEDVALIELHFAVRLVDYDEGVPVVNTIGTTSAALVPSSDSPPPPTGLAETGGDPTPLAALGLAGVLLGAAGLLLGRSRGPRRRRDGVR